MRKCLLLLVAEVAGSGLSGDAAVVERREKRRVSTARLGYMRTGERYRRGLWRSQYRNRQMPHNGHSGHRFGVVGKGLSGAHVDMLNFGGKKVYLACGKTDMRKSINGLMAIVEGSFKLNPFDEALFVFCNRNRDRVKILEWDGDGFWLYFKRLEKGHFRWPSTGEEATMKLTGEELSILLGGARVELKIRRNEVSERKVM